MVHNFSFCFFSVTFVEGVINAPIVWLLIECAVHYCLVNAAETPQLVMSGEQDFDLNSQFVI